MKLFVFDLDGTLTDTIASLVYSVNLSLKEMGLPAISEEKCQRFVGNGARVLMTKSLMEVGETDDSRIDEAMEVFGRVFDENCTFLVTPYDGIEELLTDLKKKEHKLAVLSNKPHQQTIKVVETIFGKDMFDFIQGQKDEVPRKPDPAGVYEALKFCGAKKEDCIYIGDSEVDVATGKNAGAVTVAVAWGFRTVDELMEAGAQHIIYHPKELFDLNVCEGE